MSTNIPEGTSDRVRARVDELNAEDAAKRRVAARTGQLPPEEAAEVLGTVPRQKPRDIQQEGVTMTRDVAEDGAVTESRDPEGAIEVEQERTADGHLPEHDADCPGCAAIAAERDEPQVFRVPPGTWKAAERDEEAERNRREDAAAARRVVELLADPAVADPGPRYRDAIEALGDALDEVDEMTDARAAFERILSSPTEVETDDVDAVRVALDRDPTPTYAQRVEALTTAKAILGALKSTSDFIHVASWLLGLADDDDEEGDDD